MPPKVTKVQPSGGPSAAPRGTSAASAAVAAPPPAKSRQSTAAKTKGKETPAPAAAVGAVDTSTKVVHDNEAYNEYDLNGRRVQTPEPATPFAKFLWKMKRRWRNSFAFKKKQELHSKWKDYRLRHRKHDDGANRMTACSGCCLFFLVTVAEVLLFGALALVLYWIIAYRSKDGAPFAWSSDTTLQFNLHPFLMITGFIFCMGQGMLIYRTCRCCRRIANKLVHAALHLVAIPCIIVGFIAVLESHNNRKRPDNNTPDPIPNFYSLHSWMGLATMGLFALQFLVGFFSFLLLLCCESTTASFRANLVPIHAIFGLTTFVLAVATACTGLTTKAYFNLSTEHLDEDGGGVIFKEIGDRYMDLEDEAVVINVLAAVLVALVIVMSCLMRCTAFRKGLATEATKANSLI